MAIVFVHGLFPAIYDSPSGWLCPDLPGYGANLVTPEATLPAAVDFLHSLISEPVHLVGHSIGGAIAVLFAARHPALVRSLVNVEGNFTLKDAFWSSRLASMTGSEAEQELAQLHADPAAWLTNAGVPVTPTTLAIATRSLATPWRTVQSMARSVVEITSQSGYLDEVRAVLEHRIPFHLLAGEHSLSGWDVPAFVRARAASEHVQPHSGHMLMINDLPQFVRLVEEAVR